MSRNPKPIAFVDLDGTLFRSLRRIPEKERGNTIAACVNKNGNNSSFTTRQEYNFFKWFCQETLLIPTTGRDEDEFSRILLPLPCDWKILSFGTYILGPEGIDYTWKTKVEKILDPLVGLMQEAYYILKSIAPTYRIDFCLVHELPYAIVLRSREKTPLPSDLLAEIRKLSSCIPLHCFYCGADRCIDPYGLIFLAPNIGKDKAVRYLISKFRSRDSSCPCIGIADQLSDVPYLLECDWIWTPVTSEIAKFLEITASKELWHDREQCLQKQE